VLGKVVTGAITLVEAPLVTGRVMGAKEGGNEGAKEGANDWAKVVVGNAVGMATLADVVLKPKGVV
jgi:hypothetical protein